MDLRFLPDIHMKCLVGRPPYASVVSESQWLGHKLGVFGLGLPDIPKRGREEEVQQQRVVQIVTGNEGDKSRKEII